LKEGAEVDVGVEESTGEEKYVGVGME